MALGDLNGAHLIQLVVAGVVEEDPCFNLRVGGHARFEVQGLPAMLQNKPLIPD